MKQFDAKYTKQISHHWQLKAPKRSNAKGFTDEGISSVLDKPATFRYSERFLKLWYTLI